MSLSAEKVKLQLLRLSAAMAGGRGCVLWTGAKDRDGYGRIKVTWTMPDGSTVSKTERAPRIAYMIKLGINCKTDFPLSPVVTEPLEVSHRCHDRLCVNPDHLSLEPQPVNIGRMHCKLQQLCHQGHEGYPHCLF
jgi:hypothetical protein